MKKGFTLMEMLFVALVIGLVLSFAVPVIRSVRFDAANARAKSALRKLAEARRSFYQSNKGWDIEAGSFVGAPASATCKPLPSAVGAPKKEMAHMDFDLSYTQLFNCGYLNTKNFENLPYTFHICSSGATAPCTADVSVVAVGNSDAGKKYKDYTMAINKKDMTLMEPTEEE